MSVAWTGRHRWFVVLAVVAAAGSAGASRPSRAADFFRMDLTSAIFFPQPLGPPLHFVAPAPTSTAPTPIAAGPGGTSVAEARQPTRAVRHAEAEGRRHAQPAKAGHRDPLSAFAYEPRPRIRLCAPGGICVWDGKLKRWRTP